MQKEPSKKCEIALVGGGLTTYMMATILHHSGYDFVWFSGPENTQNTARDTRTTTLHHVGMVMLKTLGVWDALAADAWPLTDIYVKIAERQGSEFGPFRTKEASAWPLHFSADNLAMGYVVDNQDLKDALAPFAKQAKRYPRTITSFTPASPNKLTDDTGQSWVCDLVIACDGPSSALRKQAGLKAKLQARGQTAIVTNIQTSRAINHTAWQIFCPLGPLALMATGTHQASVVWTVSDSRAAEIADLDAAAFNRELQASFGKSLGDLSVCSDRLVWPLRPVFVPKCTTEGFVLAGDAAHALHPLAGMGYNLALGDAAILLDCLQNARARGLPAGHISMTNAYQRRRAAEVFALTGVTQTLDRMLSRKAGLLTTLSAAGMAVLGKTAFRQQISKIAMGGSLSKAPLFSGKFHA